MSIKSDEGQITKIAKALSDKTRLKILHEIGKRGRITCTEAKEIAELSQPAVSYHVKSLMDAGLITAEKHGRQLMISVNQKVLKDLVTYLQSIQRAL